MAEYIDREETLKVLENTAKYYEGETADEWTRGIHYGLIHGIDNIVDDVKTADVVEREKIDKAIEGIERSNCFYHGSEIGIGIEIALEVLKRNIGE